MEGEKGSSAAEPEQQEARSSGRRKRIAAIIVIILCLGVGTALGGALFISQSLRPAKPGAPVRVSIPSGAGSGQIAGLLEKAGVIRSGIVFAYYLRYKKLGSKFQAGEYELQPGLSLDQIIEKLNKGETVKEEVDRFTIPEGYTLKQISDRIGEAKAANPEDFLKTADTSKDWDSKWASAIPDDPGIKHRLEGYLFPETYEVKKGSDSHDIIQRMLGELDLKLAQLPEGWQDKLAERKLTFHQMLTVASLIEREAALEEERPLIASVIYNRLKIGMPLQIDATIQYLFDQPKDRLLDADLKIESPYNTYLHDGLPPGPIASPSLSSIKAALYPADTKYLFYVTKKDGSKGHLFAETFEQHRQNIEQSKKNAK